MRVFSVVVFLEHVWMTLHTM